LVGTIASDDDLLIIKNDPTYLKQLNEDDDCLDLFYRIDLILNNINNQNNETNEQNMNNLFRIWELVFQKNILPLTKYSNYTNKSKNKDSPKIVLTFTSCKRLDLFKKTLNSILLHFEDISLVDYFFCVDDNSSKSDRAEMQKKYPWIQYYFKNENEKGHLKSMNIIYEKLSTLDPDYWIHIEDDFLFYKKMKYITLALEGFKKHKKQNIKQILFNRAYGETIFNLSTKGYIESNDKVVVHEYNPQAKVNNSVFFWPHFSFRPSIIDWKVIKELGDFSSENIFFERTYAFFFIKTGNPEKLEIIILS
jgi:hypothetical protein